MSTQKFGLVSFTENSRYDRSYRSVPIKTIEIKISVHGFIANVQSVLHYINDCDKNVETEFVFPLDTDAAVYKFEAEIEGRTTVAQVYDKSQAKMIYKDAVHAGDTAMYMAEADEAGDIFRLRLGNLSAKTTAKLTFAYVQKLDLNADQTGTFVLPTVLNPRYAPDCTPADESSGKESQEDCTRTVLCQSDIEMAYYSDFSVSLNVEIAGGENMKVYENKMEFDVISEATEKVTSSKHLQHGSDFSLLLHYKGFNKPRAIIEKGDKEEQNAFLSSDVLMVNFSPEFREFDTDMLCEFVFVIDRSGSMTGDRIEKAKEVLLLFLKSLPVDCLFNIVSFGSDFSFLFPKSKQYNEESLEEAINLQKKMDADMGGTEIFKPLERVFKTKPTDSYARQIFLLTDGEVYKVSKIVDLVRRQKNTRVFTFGIGDGCSTELVREVAKASKGKATFVKDNDRLQSKVMSALKCSLHHAITDMSLNWNLPKDCLVINSPGEVPPVFHGEKLILFAIISGEIPEDYSGGTSLKMTGKAGEISVEFSVEFDMNVCRSSDTDNSYPLHRLAAKTKLSEMEINRDDESLMVALSTALNVACKYTAFIGVDKNRKKPPSKDQDTDSSSKSEVSGLMNDGSFDLFDLALPMAKSSARPGFGRKFSNFCSCLLPTRTKERKHKKSSRYRRNGDTLHCLSSRPYEFKTYGLIDELSSEPNSLEHRYSAMEMCTLSFAGGFLDEDYEEDSAGVNDKDAFPSRMIQLIERQKFDGSWILDDNVSQILNKPLEQMKGSSVIKDTDVWATALAIAFLRKEFSAQRNEWEMIEEKALKWLKTKDLGGKDVIQEALTFLSV